MTKAVLAVALMAACGSKSPPPTEPAPTGGGTPVEAAMTPDECTARGAVVKGDIGDGKVACDPNQTFLGRVSQGIEGAVCCLAGTP